MTPIENLSAYALELLAGLFEVKREAAGKSKPKLTTLKGQETKARKKLNELLEAVRAQTPKAAEAIEYTVSVEVKSGVVQEVKLTDQAGAELEHSLKVIDEDNLEGETEDVGDPIAETVPAPLSEPVLEPFQEPVRESSRPSTVESEIRQVTDPGLVFELSMAIPDDTRNNTRRIKALETAIGCKSARTTRDTESDGSSGQRLLVVFEMKTQEECQEAIATVKAESKLVYASEFAIESFVPGTVGPAEEAIELQVETDLTEEALEEFRARVEGVTALTVGSIVSDEKGSTLFFDCKSLAEAALVGAMLGPWPAGSVMAGAELNLDLYGLDQEVLPTEIAPGVAYRSIVDPRLDRLSADERSGLELATKWVGVFADPNVSDSEEMYCSRCAYLGHVPKGMVCNNVPVADDCRFCGFRSDAI